MDLKEDLGRRGRGGVMRVKENPFPVQRRRWDSFATQSKGKNKHEKRRGASGGAPA